MNATKYGSGNAVGTWAAKNPAGKVEKAALPMRRRKSVMPDWARWSEA
nr:B32 [uncultured bacterium]ART36613.1 C501 [uncultured bacterium]ART37630.1 E421 [uncultured bacterium]ART38773.1 G116 [uncultured bacterium]ART39315.1 H496 [uncultured bacterium]